MIRGHSECIDQMTICCEVIQKDGRSDAKAAVSTVIVEHRGISSIGNSSDAFHFYRGGASTKQRKCDRAGHAAGRERLSYGYASCVSGVDTAAENQSVGSEFEVALTIAIVVTIVPVSSSFNKKRLSRQQGSDSEGKHGQSKRFFQEYGLLKPPGE